MGASGQGAWRASARISLTQGPVWPEKYAFRAPAIGPRNIGISLYDRPPASRLVAALRDEVTRISDKDKLLTFARRWLYDHKLLIEHDRALRAQIGAALDLLEAETGISITTTVPATARKWRQTLAQLRPDGQTQQSWLWEAPAKHSTVQIAQVFERIDLLYRLDVHKHLGDVSDLISAPVRPSTGESARHQWGPESKSPDALWKLHVSCVTACSPPPTRPF
jgi:hypothetical protein